MQPIQEIIYKLLALNRKTKKLGKDIHGNERWFGANENNLVDVNSMTPIKLSYDWELIINKTGINISDKQKHYDIRKIKVQNVTNNTRILFSQNMQQDDISEILVDENGLYLIDSEPVEIGISTYAKKIGDDAEIFIGIIGL